MAGTRVRRHIIRLVRRDFVLACHIFVVMGPASMGAVVARRVVHVLVVQMSLWTVQVVRVSVVNNHNVVWRVMGVRMWFHVNY